MKCTLTLYRGLFNIYYFKISCINGIDLTTNVVSHLKTVCLGLVGRNMIYCLVVFGLDKIKLFATTIICSNSLCAHLYNKRVVSYW